MKKSISFLLILTMILSMLCIVPAAADGDKKQSGDFYYRVKRNGTAVITGYNFPASAKNLNIAVPITIGGYPVTEIGESAFSVSYSYDNRKQYQNVSIYLPNGITSIGNFAFRGLDITELNIPDSVEEIGYGILFGYSWFDSKSITLNISVNHPRFALIDGLLYNKQQKKLIASTTNELDSIAIPEGIVSIGDYALSNTKMKDVAFPDTLKEIGNHAFEGAAFNASTVANFPSFINVQTVGSYAFYNTETMSCDITFCSLEEIGEAAFSGDDFLTTFSVCFENCPITIVSDNAFDTPRSDITTYRTRTLEITMLNFSEIDDPESLDSLYSFFSIPRSIISIGKSNYCLGAHFISLEDFPPYLTSIPESLCPAVNSLPNTVKRIELKAYINPNNKDDKRTDFYLPSSLEYIAEDAFATGSTFIVEPDSYALRWCKDNGFGYKINGEKQDLDWLNN